MFSCLILRIPTPYGTDTYRELGFEKILLVEGVTEVLAVQQVLRMYNKDHRVVLLPMGGSSFINGTRESELVEITRITTNVHALIDSERSSPGTSLEKDRQDFVTVCKRLLKNYCRVFDGFGRPSTALQDKGR